MVQAGVRQRCWCFIIKWNWQSNMQPHLRLILLYLCGWQTCNLKFYFSVIILQPVSVLLHLIKRCVDEGIFLQLRMQCKVWATFYLGYHHSSPFTHPTGITLCAPASDSDVLPLPKDGIIGHVILIMTPSTFEISLMSMTPIESDSTCRICGLIPRLRVVDSTGI